NHLIIENVDATIIAQRPKMAPHIPQMRENIARAIGISVNRVNVKATTEEGLGFTGSGEGISSQAICLLSEVANYAYDDGMMSERICTGCAGCIKREEV
ncbi:MAG: 2-C-methyl-D-erythritol 2,4-cyclodiphosphate synthase, partial [Lachnospiraceae bacterium]